MRLLFLCKRHPQQRDLLQRPFGRFHHLPRELAARGHEVHVAMLSHRRLPTEEAHDAGMHRYADDLLAGGPRRYWRRLNHLAERERFDWIVGCSDIYYGALALSLAARHGAKAAIDAYDDFESYMPWNLPLHALWRRSLHRARLVTAAGPQLAERLQSLGAARVRVLPMAADPQFRPMVRATCRRELQLPEDARLLVHAGSFTRSRGSAILLDALDRVRRVRPETQLVLSGRHPAELAQHPGVRSVGMLADAQVPSLLNSADVVCVALADTRFGRFSYPAKLYEAIACEIPVIASATEPVRWILAEDQRCLAPVGDSNAYARKVVESLDTGQRTYAPQASWGELASQYEAHLSEK